MVKAIDVNAENFEQEVLKAETLVLVDFWAPWCQPCKLMAPILEELAGDETLTGKIKIAKLNVEEEENEDLTNEYSVMSIPNMKLFKGGKVVHEIVGLRSAEAMREELEKFI